MKFLSTLTDSFLGLIYPSFCIHCNLYMPHAEFPLCADCLTLLQIIDSHERCPLCFSAHYCPLQNRCAYCDCISSMVDRMAAAFDYEGPASTIVRKLKYGGSPHLAEGMGAWMAAQYVTLNWPLPDVIVPVPISFTRKLERGYNQSELLSESISRILNVPVVNVLGRNSGDFSQAGLSREQRMTLDGRSLYMRQQDVVTGKIILLVDDVVTTGSTMNRCAEVLSEDSPLAVYGLAFCKTV